MSVQPPPPPPLRDDEVAAVYLRGRDVPCPGCGYNRRDGAGRACPECGMVLVLEPETTPWRRRLFVVSVLVYIYVLLRGLLFGALTIVNLVQIIMYAPPFFDGWWIARVSLSGAVDLGTAIAAIVLLCIQLKKRDKPGAIGPVVLLGSVMAGGLLGVATNMISSFF